MILETSSAVFQLIIIVVTPRPIDTWVANSAAMEDPLGSPCTLMRQSQIPVTRTPAPKEELPEFVSHFLGGWVQGATGQGNRVRIKGVMIVCCFCKVLFM